MIATMILVLLAGVVAGGLLWFGLSSLRQPRVAKGEETALEKLVADRFRNFLAFTLIGAFLGMLPMLLFKEMPEGNKEVIVYIIGQVSGMATTALAFYFAQSKGQEALDAKRTENTGKMAEAITKVAEATGVPDHGRAAGKAADQVAGAAEEKAAEINAEHDPTGNYEEGKP
jgi:hypothetical protein